MTDERWQETWDKMEETERRERDIGEPPEPCSECGGSEILEVWQGSYPNGMHFLSSKCPRCRGKL